jgi:predicted Zn-dependent protease with MMP-like domain
MTRVATLGGKIKRAYIWDMAATGKYSSAPTLGDIEAIASEAFATIPRALAQHVADVAIHVVDFPDDETLEALELESPFDLLGLYRGISLDQKSVADTLTDIDRIYLYRRPLLDYWCESGEDLYHVVRHVLIHEIGHHFGLSDDDMEAIEARA